MLQTRSTLQRLVHLVGLVAVPILTLVFAVRDQSFDYDGGAGARFDEYAGNADLFLQQGVLFLAIQLLLVPAALAFPWLVHGRGRTLVLLGSGLYVLSAFGHAAFSGAQLVVHRMLLADDADAMRQAFIAFDESGPFVVIAAPGLVGLVLGTLLLGIGIIRSVELPWWIGAAFIGFVVAEFALSGAFDWGTLVSAAFWAIAFLGTALVVLRSRDAATTPPV